MIYLISIAGLLFICFVIFFIFHQISSKSKHSKPLSDSTNNKIISNTLSCSCQEWLLERARFKQSDPRRLCLHLCNYFASNNNKIPEQLKIFTNTINLMNDQNTGIPHKPPAFVFVLGESGYIASIAEDKHPWITIFTEDKTYYFNLADGIWKDNILPDFSNEIGDLVNVEIRKRQQQEKNMAKK